MLHSLQPGPVVLLRLGLSGDEVGHSWDGVGDLSVFGGVDEAFLDEAVSDWSDAGGGLFESGGDLAGLAGAFAVLGHGLEVGALGWCGSFPPGAGETRPLRGVGRVRPP